LIASRSSDSPFKARLAIDAIVDTGYDGSLTLTPALIVQLGLIWLHHGCATLADGTTCAFGIYRGDVIWDGQVRPILVDEADTMPLLGMAMLEGYELMMQVRPQGRVTITPLP
jgi:clan AA aspartic protease